MEKAENKRSPFPMMRWKVDRYRKDRRVGPVQVSGRSDYMQLLFEKGAGWDEQRSD